MSACLNQMPHEVLFAVCWRIWPSTASREGVEVLALALVVTNRLRPYRQCSIILSTTSTNLDMHCGVPGRRGR